MPKEIARREALRDKLDAARRRLEAQAEARAAAEREAHEAKVAAREKRRGRAKGKHPKPPAETPAADAQSNLSDPDSRLMRKSKHHEYRQAYNAQAAVDAGGSQLIVGARVSQCASDRNDLVADIEAIPAALGRPETVLADNGYANGAEVAALEASGRGVGVDLGGRPSSDTRLPPGEGSPGGKGAQGRLVEGDGGEARERRGPCLLQASPADRRAGLRRHQGGARLRRVLAARPREGRGRVDPGGSRLQLQALAVVVLRRQTVEPVFGVIKAVLGFAGFSLRGLEKVEGEWTLVALAYNCKRLHKLSLAV